MKGLGGTKDLAGQGSRGIKDGMRGNGGLAGNPVREPSGPRTVGAGYDAGLGEV